MQGHGFVSGRYSCLQDDVMSFDESFYVYGGQQAFEEVEALSNECAR